MYKVYQPYKDPMYVQNTECSSRVTSSYLIDLKDTEFI